MRPSPTRLVVLALSGFLLAGMPAGIAGAQGWQKPPGPIAGRWQATCDNEAGMIVAFTVSGPRGAGERAVGTIATLGDKAGQRGYTEGEVILHLTADAYGDWVGTLLWRSAAGAHRHDPIRFVATANKLNATMTTDNCYENMPRAH